MQKTGNIYLFVKSTGEIRTPIGLTSVGGNTIRFVPSSVVASSLSCAQLLMEQLESGATLQLQLKYVTVAEGRQSLNQHSWSFILLSDTN